MKRNDREHSDPSAKTEQPRDEDFLKRWSRRKAQAREQPQPPIDTTESSASPPSPDAGVEPPPLTDADMPKIESLTAESDVSCFFSPGVSEKLRRMALRKVFSLSVYNVRDGLDDYDDDFTVFEPLGDTVTADMRHRQEREAEKQREREAAEQQLAQAEAEDDSDAEEQQAATAVDDEPESSAPADPGADPDADQEGDRRDA